MRNIDSMEWLTRYIDEHIGVELTAQELADRAGYSLYHFCHLFKSCTGSSIGLYLRNRRLDLAADELMGSSSITDVAFKYGFCTHTGFSKAFRKYYGVTPSEYKATKGGIIKMVPELKKMPAFSAVGYSLAPPDGDFKVLDISAYWLGKDFSSVSKEDYAKLVTPDRGEIGAWMHPDAVSGAFYYFFGPIVRDKSFIPEGMVALDVPEAEYAVFAVPVAESPEGLSSNIQGAMKDIFAGWFDSSGYNLAENKIIFEHYMGKDTFIYVPVEKNPPEI